MDYAQSRLQARFGERPDESLWQVLEVAPEFGVALDIARASGLRRWVRGITAQADHHALEVALRERWRECVAETASWMPVQWQPAMKWVQGLVDVPALCYLARGEAPLSWMHIDPVLQVYARADSRSRESLLRRDWGAFPCPPPEAAARAATPADLWPARIGDAWVAEWRRRWPRWSQTEALDPLAQLLLAAMKQPAAIGRPALVRELRGLFRRAVLCPAAAFIYVAFAALDVARLRAGLLKHVLARAGVVAS